MNFYQLACVLVRCRTQPSRYMKSQYNGEPWVLGGGWRDDWFPDRTPRAEQLDEIFGKDVAVMLRRWDMHASWQVLPRT